ncbi:hypothetical protein ACIQC7_27975 [Kitasatospora sp. NPDC088556]|uniref:hypothetical protein n=1 Tax=Kitasatospora sp. NPDC088556 TaxID=3364076 RepID=UPI003815144A
MSNTRRTTTRQDSADAPEEVGAAEAQEIEAAGHHVTVSLAGEALRTVPATAWRASTQRKLRLGDFDGFMQDVLAPDDYEQYIDIDPTNDELGQFVTDAYALSGESEGKSRGPRPSSRSTRRR